jgi:hypothetical protein
MDGVPTPNKKRPRSYYCHIDHIHPLTVGWFHVVWPWWYLLLELVVVSVVVGLLVVLYNVCCFLFEIVKAPDALYQPSHLIAFQ